MIEGSPRVVARRRQRLRRVVGGLIGVAVLVGVGGYLLWRGTRPDVRKPGEDLPEITRKLELELPADAPVPRFIDRTAAAGLGDFVTFSGERSSQLPEDMGSGAAWGDYDGDGDDDLFVVAAGGPITAEPSTWAESMLFENRGDGTFARVTEFPETRIVGMGAAWGDADGDGRLDLAVSGYGALMLFKNTPDGFVRDGSFPAPDGYWAGVAWGDFDNDRDLDLYVCGYVVYVPDDSSTRRASQQYGTAVPYTLNPASFEPERNLLLENDGAGRFRDVALEWGVSNPGGRSLSALWHDFDADGRLDLYVANDISDNALFLNRGETFEDVSLAAWVADYRGAMGLAAGDWNRDGDDDLFVTHWMAQENALYDSRLVDMQRLPPDGGQGAVGAPATPTFADLSAPLGLGQPALQSVGWGTEFVDLDGDGWLDLPIANGSTFETDDEPRRLKPQPSMIFWNQQGKAFHDIAPLGEHFSEPRVSRGLAVADFDRDGDQDLLVVQLDGGVTLLANEMQSGNWVELTLRSLDRASEPRGFADGATVELSAGGALLRRTVGGASYLSQHSRTLHFGLGEAGAIDSVVVRWPGGESEPFSGVAPGGRWELVEGTGAARRLAGGAAAAGSGDEAAPGSGNEVEATASLGPAERQRLIEFWELQREGMNLVKREGDCAAAAPVFRAALKLNPEHEDARYYLANCLAELGRVDEALAELDTLRRLNPLSHRGHKQWGVLRALNARSRADLEAAEAALARALEVNREETGGLLVLGEVALMAGHDEAASEYFEDACSTNPQAATGFFFRAYLAWKASRVEESSELLAEVRRARGPEWKPEGTVAEGDTAKRMHREQTPLGRFVEGWVGETGPDRAFRELDEYLASWN